MSQLILMIGHVDDLDNPQALTEVWQRAMPVMELSRMRPEHYLNGLENEVMEVGWEAMRTLMVELLIQTRQGCPVKWGHLAGSGGHPALIEGEQ